MILDLRSCETAAAAKSLEDKLSDAKPLREVLNNIIKKSPSLAASIHQRVKI